ncbi:site-2 protease family protein [Candidatus Methylocalor cossyra]|uniref:Peptidase M50 n=1 Tax=Candidatus Methylocalor cossyra TaxID=3108543 RepID=A0ABM9NLA7_9GAMM
MEQLTLVQIIAVAILPVLFAITLHEVAHGWVAQWLGDDTAARLGRLSVNPIHHIDPLGTVLIPGLLLLLKAGFLFGWAKPVPVDFNRLRHPKRDMALVALAGPLANLFMAIVWALLIRLAILIDLPYASVPLALMGQLGISVNIVLMLINLIPIPPLDGGRVAVGLLPYQLAVPFSRLEPYGFLILLALMFTNSLSLLLGLPMRVLHGLLLGLAGL